MSRIGELIVQSWRRATWSVAKLLLRRRLFSQRIAMEVADYKQEYGKPPPGF